jgi:hypothetical protein
MGAPRGAPNWPETGAFRGRFDQSERKASQVAGRDAPRQVAIAILRRPRA